MPAPAPQLQQDVRYEATVEDIRAAIEEMRADGLG